LFPSPEINAILSSWERGSALRSLARRGGCRRDSLAAGLGNKVSEEDCDLGPLESAARHRGGRRRAAGGRLGQGSGNRGEGRKAGLPLNLTFAVAVGGKAGQCHTAKCSHSDAIEKHR